MISSGSPHVRTMGRTCGEPDEIELAAMGVKLNGSRCRTTTRGAASRQRCTPWAVQSRHNGGQFKSVNRPLTCTYAPCGPSVRAGELAKSRKIHEITKNTRNHEKLSLPFPVGVQAAEVDPIFCPAQVSAEEWAYASRAVQFHPHGGQFDPVSFGPPHVRPMGVHRTCSEPNGINEQYPHGKCYRSFV